MSDDDFHNRLAVLSVFGTQEMADRAAYKTLLAGTHYLPQGKAMTARPITQDERDGYLMSDWHAALAQLRIARDQALAGGRLRIRPVAATMTDDDVRRTMAAGVMRLAEEILVNAIIVREPAGERR